MRSEGNTIQYSSLELTSMCNYLMKESFQLIIEEVDYFFDQKEYLIDVFVDGIDYGKLNAKSLQARFHKIMYSSNEVHLFQLRLEKMLKREWEKVPVQMELSLQTNLEDTLAIDNCFSYINEAARTHTVSCCAARAVDLAWRKTSRNIMPRGLGKAGMLLHVGECCLSSIGLSPKQVKCDIRMKLAKTINGILKNHKLAVIQLLKDEITAQILAQQELRNVEDTHLKPVKTA